MKLETFAEGRWQAGNAQGLPMADPVNGEVLGYVDATGVDYAATMDYARNRGGKALRAMSFEERGAVLDAIAATLKANRDAYGEIARRNSGNTAFDAAIDIDGAISTLRAYSRHAAQLGAAHTIVEPGSDSLARDGNFAVLHQWSSIPGVAVHINAFNFPAWGLWEKAAVAILAGVPILAKPASATAWLPHQMIRDVVAQGVLPEGVLSLICGSGEGLLAALQPFDMLSFTGSAETARALRAHPNVIASAVRMNIEADSINATVLGADARPGDPVFDLLLREVVNAMTVKAGQMCTNIRRILVPADRLPEVREALIEKMRGIVVGDPANEGVRMGPLVSKAQQQAAIEGLQQLARDTTLLSGGGVPESLSGGDADKGAFLAPTLLECQDPDAAGVAHETEVFGPVATLMPYRDAGHAAHLVQRGGGSLVTSLFSDDAEFMTAMAAEIAPYNGRVMMVDEAVGKSHSGHQFALPQCVHGGPGRAGGGEELGGLRGLRFYMQRSAMQGGPALLERLAKRTAEASL